jgi:hypothetical protein
MSAFDFDAARAGLRGRLHATEAGGRRLWTEPLYAAGDGGSLLQVIRIEGASRPDVEVRTESGDLVASRTEPGPDGVRVFVPEVDSAQPLTVDGTAFLLEPQRKWTVHLIHHSHLDIGYTDPQGTVLAEHLSFLDSCLDLAGQTDDWPEESRFRWAVEALWSFDQWSRNRPAARVEEFVDRVRQGRIELTAMPFNLHTETCSTDELHELFRLARTVKSRYGLELPVAMQTDVPGAVVGLVDAMAQNGVRYLSVAHNWAGRSVPHLVGGQDLPRLFRWQAPSGASVLVWMTDTPHGMAYMEGPLLGFHDSFERVDDLLPAYLRSLSTNAYPFDGKAFGVDTSVDDLYREPYPWDVVHLRVQGKFGDNAPPRRIIADTVRRWNERWAYPKLRLSRNEDFFADAERRYGDRIRTFTGDWNDWWADGIGSGARPLQLVRRAQGTLADAQTIGALAGLVGAEHSDDADDAGRAYLAASLFDEHTWGAADPWTHGDDHTHSGDEQWHWKYSRAIDAHDDARILHDRSAHRLSERLAVAEDALASFYVVNTCGWTRTETATAFLPESRVPLETDIAVRDARTGKVLPVERRAQVNPDHRTAGQFLRVVMDDVPPVGMVRLDVVPNGTSVAAGNEPVGDAPVLDNEYLTVRVDLPTASIASIVDKATGRELVNDDAIFGFNAYVYDLYASAGGLNHKSSSLRADESMNMLGRRELARPAAVIELTTHILVYESRVPGADWVRTTLTLPAGQARLDIENRIAKPATMAKESAYFAFPFAVADPVVRVEAAGGVVGTGLSQVPGGATHMRAIRRWVSLADDEVAIAWTTQDAALVQLGDIVLPYSPFPVSTPEYEDATVYSWVHNNLWDTNFPSRQGFEMTLRYSVAATRADGPDAGPVLGMRTAASTSRPLTAVLAGGTGTAPAEESWLSVSDDRVRVVGLTAPSPGAILVRLQSITGSPVDAVVKASFDVVSAARATYLGDELEPLPAGVPVCLAPYATTAILFTLRS